MAYQEPCTRQAFSDAASSVAGDIGGAFALRPQQQSNPLQHADMKPSVKSIPPPPSMAASGKDNPFAGAPFRHEDVHKKASILVSDEGLWKDFQAELNSSGVKTDVGVKMVLLRFVTNRIPADEIGASSCAALLEMLWSRMRKECSRESDGMKHASSSPCIAEMNSCAAMGKKMKNSISSLSLAELAMANRVKHSVGPSFLDVICSNDAMRKSTSDSMGFMGSISFANLYQSVVTSLEAEVATTRTRQSSLSQHRMPIRMASAASFSSGSTRNIRSSGSVGMLPGISSKIAAGMRSEAFLTSMISEVSLADAGKTDLNVSFLGRRGDSYNNLSQSCNESTFAIGYSLEED